MKIETTQHRRRGRPATRKDKHGLPVPVRASRDRALTFFFEDLPSGDLDEAMQLSGDERFSKLHDALHDPAYRNTTEMTLCRRFGISWLDLMNLWWQYNIDLGLIRIANYLPQVLEDIAIDALSREEGCSRCDGEGQVGETGDRRQCPVCEGRRTVRVPGDPDARKLVLEVMRRNANSLAVNSGNVGALTVCRHDEGLVVRSRVPMVPLQQCS